jgi:hypothetical protein
MAAVHISPWGLVFQTELTGRCRQTTTINQYPGTDGSSRSQYSAVCITSIDGLMPPDLVTNCSDSANFSTLWNSCAAQPPLPPHPARQRSLSLRFGIRSRFAIVSREQKAESLVNTLVNQDFRETRAKRSSLDSFRTWTANSRLTLGNPREKSRETRRALSTRTSSSPDRRASKNGLSVHHLRISRDRSCRFRLLLSMHLRVAGRTYQDCEY